VGNSCKRLEQLDLPFTCRLLEKLPAQLYAALLYEGGVSSTTFGGSYEGGYHKLCHSRSVQHPSRALQHTKKVFAGLLQIFF